MLGAIEQGWAIIAYGSFSILNLEISFVAQFKVKTLHFIRNSGLVQLYLSLQP